MRRTCALLFGVLLLSAVTPVRAEPFLDVVGHSQAEQIETLHLRGVVQGYGSGIFRPDILVNRAEYLKILMLAVTGAVPVSDTTGCFADFAGSPQWYWATACAAKERKVTDGYPDGTFRGEQTVNFAEALKMAERAWQMPIPAYIETPEHWYDPFFAAVAGRGITEYFFGNPGHLLTRGDAAWILVSLRQPIADVIASSSSSVSSLPGEAPSGAKSGASSVSVHSVCGNGVREGREQCDDGNREDGDGCSSLCIIVPEPIMHSAIRLDQRPLGTDTRTGGTSQTVLFRFDAVARWQGAILTGLKLRAAEGALIAAFNYRLYQDEDGDGRAESLVGSGLVREGVLSFSDIQPLIHVDRGTRFEVRGDLTQTSGTSFALGFLTSDPAYVGAVGAIDGRELTGIRTDGVRCASTYTNCWIAVYTREPAEPVTVTERGNLFVTQSTQPLRSHQLLMGSETEPLLRLSLRATEEDIAVTRMTIQGATDSLSHLELYEPGASTPFTTATSAQCRSPATGKFCAVMNFLVRKDLTRDILFRAAVKPDEEGAQSGDAVALTLPATTTALDKPVEATGSASQQLLSQNDGDSTAEGEIFIGQSTAGANSAITGPTHDVVKAAFAEVMNGSTVADGAPVPVGLNVIGAFRFRAALSSVVIGVHEATIESLAFTVSATNVRFSTGSFVLVNTLAPTIPAPCTETSVTGAFRVVCSALEQSGVATSFSQGTSSVLALKGFIESSKVVPTGVSLLHVSLANVNDRSVTGPVEWSDGVVTFTWVDIPETDVRSTLYQIP